MKNQNQIKTDSAKPQSDKKTWVMPVIEAISIESGTNTTKHEGTAKPGIYAS